MPGTAAKLVDADTHVSENEQMWEHFEREMYHRRPVLIREAWRSWRLGGFMRSSPMPYPTIPRSARSAAPPAHHPASVAPAGSGSASKEQAYSSF